MSPAYSKYTLFWMALYGSTGSACFVKCIALWGQSESWECQNRFRERRKPRPADSYEQSCLNRSFLSAFFSTVPRMYCICMPFGGHTGQNRFLSCFASTNAVFSTFKCDSRCVSYFGAVLGGLERQNRFRERQKLSTGDLVSVPFSNFPRLH